MYYALRLTHKYNDNHYTIECIYIQLYANGVAMKEMNIVTDVRCYLLVRRKTLRFIAVDSLRHSNSTPIQSHQRTSNYIIGTNTQLRVHIMRI